MWNAFDVDVLSEITSEEVRFRGSLGDETVGRGELEGYVRMVQRAFPDFTNEIIELVSDGSRAFARLRYRGTHLGPLGSVSPTGRTVSYDGAALFHTDGRRITSVWVLGDRLALLQQLGQDHTGGAGSSS
jgi:predicted ester cyclase